MKLSKLVVCIVALLAINALFVAAKMQYYYGGGYGQSSGATTSPAAGGVLTSGSSDTAMGTSDTGNAMMTGGMTQNGPANMGMYTRRNIQCNIPPLNTAEFNPKDVDFVAKGNRACQTLNKYSSLCLQTCIKQVSTLAQSIGRNVLRPKRTGCQMADQATLTGLTPDMCYSAARDACNKANPGNTYCSSFTCLKNALFTCRQNGFVAHMRK